MPLKKPKQDTEACNCKEELTQDPTDLAWYCESRLSSACWLTEASGDEAGLFRDWAGPFQGFLTVPENQLTAMKA